MKKLLLGALLLLAVFIAACSNQNIQPQPGEVYCTQEAMACDDGSYVGRNASNDCAFDPCPVVDETNNPDIIGSFDCNGKTYTAYTVGYCARATFPTGTSCIMTKEGDIVVPGSEEADVQECLAAKNDFWCGNKHYIIDSENRGCYHITTSEGYTCIDTPLGSLFVLKTEEKDARSCIEKCGVHQGREYPAEDGCNVSTCSPKGVLTTTRWCSERGDTQ